MKKILTLRVSRRAVGAAVLTGEDLVFTDGRHLSSRRDRTVVAALRYVERLCEEMQPGALDLPGHARCGVNRRDLIGRAAGRVHDEALVSHHQFLGFVSE